MAGDLRPSRSERTRGGQGAGRSLRTTGQGHPAHPFDHPDALSGEKVARFADVYFGLVEKQKAFTRKAGIEVEQDTKSDEDALIEKLGKYFTYVEKVGLFKAHNCKYVGEDRYRTSWSWNSEPTTLSRSSKKVRKGEYHLVASSLVCAPCHAFVSKTPGPK